MKVRKPSKRALLIAALVASIGVGVGVGALLTNITERKMEGEMYPLTVVDVSEDEIDPEVWGQNFPMHYDSFMRTREDSGRTEYGGSTPFNKLEENPFLRTAWADYAFAVDYNNARGHHYAQIDQQETKRTQEFDQPGACVNCHAAEAPLLIEELGWEEFNRTPYNELKDDLHYGSSCADCHDPDTMELRITRPAFENAMERRGVDLDDASRQDMRSYVCAQCHVNYYFKGENKVLTFPWDEGLGIDDIEAYFEEAEFEADWTHGITEAPMLKAQHPEFELFSTGTHAESGVSCADCHMPYTRVGGVKVSDHQIRSPLFNVNNACQTCHAQSEESLRQSVGRIQDRTYELIQSSQDAIEDAIDEIAAAMDAGAGDEALEEARDYHRRAQLRWDFVYSENSMGFHSPQEAAGILADSIDFARRAELLAARARGTAGEPAERDETEEAEGEGEEDADAEGEAEEGDAEEAAQQEGAPGEALDAGASPPADASER